MIVPIDGQGIRYQWKGKGMVEKSESGAYRPRRIIAGSEGKTVRVFKKGTREWEYWVNLVKRLGERQASQSMDLVETYVKTLVKLENIDEKVDESLESASIRDKDQVAIVKNFVDIREKLSKQLILIGKELGINEKGHIAATKGDVTAALDEKHGGRDL